MNTQEYNNTKKKIMEETNAFNETINRLEARQELDKLLNQSKTINNRIYELENYLGVYDSH